MKKPARHLMAAAITSFLLTALPFEAFAQAYVNQAAPTASYNPAYLQQVPPGAKPMAPRRQVIRPKTQATAERPAVLPASGKPSLAHIYPSVGTGSTAIVRPTSPDWPTVGRGTVTR
ncbi:hypothetical protein [Rhizobium halophytocola]|uniref:Uncharacterized protein n=1 Tax=Rhizobium halophytocola TaxID=735519 RepID=A0ABS4DUT7_9HYPH|nr:hypothetical protein [Rhizobium halophytocola]MBP1849442.1 hypothetical protein [Rhizobium halophytocola]